MQRTRPMPKWQKWQLFERFYCQMGVLRSYTKSGLLGVYRSPLYPAWTAISGDSLPFEIVKRIRSKSKIKI